MANGYKTGGRQKGTPNKLTATLKEAILEAAEQAHEEGTVGYLRAQAASNPVAFMSLLGKVLPMVHAGDPENPLHLAVSQIALVAPNLDHDKG